MGNEYTWEIAPCQEGAGFTLREKESGQMMHSRIGPWIEATQIYVGQSELGRRARMAQESGKPIVVYDVGLGIAANPLALLEARPEAPVEIYSFERSPDALAQALQNPDAFGFLAPHVEKLGALLKTGAWSREGIHWRLLSGDFRDQDLAGLPPADLVYFDFYAPAVCPELWTGAIFSKIRASIQPDGLLITYASNKAIRSALLLAGFFVGDGTSTAIKGETSVASPSFSLLQKPLSRKWLDRLEKSPKPLPLDWAESRRTEALSLIRNHPQFCP